MKQRRSLVYAFPLAFIALFFASLAPQGFMPMQTINGFVIMICSGHGPASEQSSTDHAHHGSKPHPSSHDPENWEKSVCSYAAAPALGIDLAPPVTELQMNPVGEYASWWSKRFALRNRINIPPATGPPLTV